MAWEREIGARAGQSGFSAQPGSGSAIGGRRGSQEYGITGGLAADERHEQSGPLQVEESEESGESEALAEILESDAATSPKEVQSLLAKRLHEHPVLSKRRIEATVTDSKEVLLKGVVTTVAERMAARELAEAVAEKMRVFDFLRIVP